MQRHTFHFIPACRIVLQIPLSTYTLVELKKKVQKLKVYSAIISFDNLFQGPSLWCKLYGLVSQSFYTFLKGLFTILNTLFDVLVTSFSSGRTLSVTSIFFNFSYEEGIIL